MPNQTALHGAAEHGFDKYIEFLVAHGADLTVKDATGRTPLDVARGAGGVRLKAERPMRNSRKNKKKKQKKQKKKKRGPAGDPDEGQRPPGSRGSRPPGIGFRETVIEFYFPGGHFPTMCAGSRLFSSQMLSMRSVSGSRRQASLTVHGLV